MKSVRYSCDVCGRKIRRPDGGPLERVFVRMRTRGYGMRDGDHVYRAHICSSECGIRVLHLVVARIAGADEKLGEEAHAILDRAHR